MLSYHLVTYGCQMNESDSERIHAYLQSNNLTPIDKNHADILIFNACAIRQSAVDRIYGQINNTQKNKTKKPLIIITGCILPNDSKKIKQKNVLILNITKLSSWLKLIKKHLSTLNKSNTPHLSLKITSNKKNILSGSLKSYFKIQPQHTTNYTALVPVMTGCNNFCSYCAVPYTRGREQSRPVNDILKEIKKLIKTGYQEIILLGQNVNSYQGKLNKNSKTINFPTLLKLIDTIPGNYWLNFISSHPKDLSYELIKCFKTLKHLTPYLHLPVQSGSNKIIKKMNRHYTVAHYKKLIQQLRLINPDIAITTDIIVGFPGETLVDFKKTINLIKTIKFDLVYISQFSPRPHTIAATFENKLDKTEKNQREKILNTAVKKIALKKNQQYLKLTLEVLVKKIKKNKTTFNSDQYIYYGHTNQFKNVKILTSSKQPIKIGQLVKVKINKVTAWSLQGNLSHGKNNLNERYVV